MSVEKELQELTGVTQNRREADQAYLERVVKALNDVSDSKYNKLSKAAQTWAEEATEAYNTKDDISAFPEAEEDDEAEAEAPSSRRSRSRRSDDDDESDDEATESEDDESEDAEDDGEQPEDDEPEDDDMPATRTDEDEAPRKRAGAKAASTRKAAPAAKTGKTDGKSGGGAKAGGGLTYVRELLVKNPDITVADLAEKVKAKGHTVSTQTLHTTRSGFRQDLRVLQDAGLLKRKLV